MEKYIWVVDKPLGYLFGSIDSELLPSQLPYTWLIHSIIPSQTLSPRTHRLVFGPIIEEWLMTNDCIFWLDRCSLIGAYLHAFKVFPNQYLAAQSRSESIQMCKNKSCQLLTLRRPNPMESARTYVSVTSNAKSSISSSSSAISGNLSNMSCSNTKWHVLHANSAPQAPVGMEKYMAYKLSTSTWISSQQYHHSNPFMSRTF